MDLIAQYQSSDEQNECDSDTDVHGTPINMECSWEVTTQERFDVEEDADIHLQATPINHEYQEMHERTVRTVYLVTYSNADRTTFVEAVIKCFNGGKAQVKDWVCSMESHESGAHHFHAAVALDRLKRWRMVKQQLQEEYEIVVHFSDIHTNYNHAWRYVTKSDLRYIEKRPNPYFATHTPRTSRATAARRVHGHPQYKKCIKRLTPLAFTQLVKRNNIHRIVQLMALIKSEEESGRFTLSEFFHNRKRSKVEELISSTWEIENSHVTLEREKLSRVDILSNYLEKEVCNCDGVWLQLARETLDNNGINGVQFASSVVSALEDGRKKGNNILLIGEGNCAKSFLLLQLKKVYKCFTNPPTGSLNWNGLASCKVLL